MPSGFAGPGGRDGRRRLADADARKPAAAVAAGAQRRAWDAFVARYGAQIAAWCRQWRLQPADADDVTQNVLLKLAGYLRTFAYDPGRRFRGQLRVMAHNACKDYLAGKHRAGAPWGWCTWRSRPA
jgi:RNA polymerase sigma-70 factor (ECF subfamily)